MVAVGAAGDASNWQAAISGAFSARLFLQKYLTANAVDDRLRAIAITHLASCRGGINARFLLTSRNIQPTWRTRKAVVDSTAISETTPDAARPFLVVAASEVHAAELGTALSPDATSRVSRQR